MTIRSGRPVVELHHWARSTGRWFPLGVLGRTIRLTQFGPHRKVRSFFCRGGALTRPPPSETAENLQQTRRGDSRIARRCQNDHVIARSRQATWQSRGGFRLVPLIWRGIHRNGRAIRELPLHYDMKNARRSAGVHLFQGIDGLPCGLDGGGGGVLAVEFAGHGQAHGHALALKLHGAGLGSLGT